jgi:hypothetical protein
MNKFSWNVVKGMKGGRFHAIQLCSKQESPQTLRGLRGDIETLGQGRKDQIPVASQRGSCLRRRLVLEYARTSQNCLCKSVVQRTAR